MYDFCCQKCSSDFEELTGYDETGEYAEITCPECGAADIEKVVSHCFAFSFTDPVGTDRYNNSHDYRYKHKAPAIAANREAAKNASHMGTEPYNHIDDVSSGKHFGDVQ